jgi:hypothetical protein
MMILSEKLLRQVQCGFDLAGAIGFDDERQATLDDRDHRLEIATARRQLTRRIALVVRAPPHVLARIREQVAQALQHLRARATDLFSLAADVGGHRHRSLEHHRRQVSVGKVHERGLSSNETPARDHTNGRYAVVARDLDERRTRVETLPHLVRGRDRVTATSGRRVIRFLYGADFHDA